MGVGTHDRADLPVEKTREGDFLRGRLGMKIHENEFGPFPEFFHLVIGGGKRVVQWRLHERPALYIQYADQNRALSFGGWILDFKNPAAVAGNSRRIIQRPQKT